MKIERPQPGTFLAAVDLLGKMSFVEEERAARAAWLLRFAGKAVDVSVVEHEDTRSANANAYYWACVIAPATDHNGDDPDDFHDEMCARFLTRRRIDIVDVETGEAIEVTIPGRSRKLRIGDFYQFVEQVRKFVGFELGVETADPDPEYWRKRATA